MSLDAGITKERLMEVLSKVNSEKNELIKTKAETEERIAQLLHENTQLKQIIASENAQQSDVFSKERERMEADFNIVLSQQTELAREQGEQLQQVLSALENEQARTRALEEEAEIGARRIAQLEQDLGQTRGLNSSFGEFATQNEALVLQIEALQRELQVLKEEERASNGSGSPSELAEVFELQQIKQELAAKQASAEAELDLAKQKHFAQEQVLFELQTKLTALTALVESKDLELHELRIAKEMEQQAMEQKISSLEYASEFEMEDLRQQLASKDLELETLKQQSLLESADVVDAAALQNAQQQLGVMTLEVEALRQSLQASSAAEMEVQGLKEALTSLEAAKEQDMQEIKRMAALVQERDAEIQQLRSELATDAETRDLELQSLKHQVFSLAGEKELAVEALKQQVVSLRDEKAEEMERLKQEMEAAKTEEMETLKQEMKSAKTEEIQSLHQQIFSLESEKELALESWKQQLWAKEMELEALQQQQQTVVLEKDNTADLLLQQEQHAAAIAALHESNQVLSSKLVLAEAKIKQYEEGQQQPPLAVEKLEREKADLTAQVQALETLKRSFSQSLASLETQTEQFERRLKEERHRVNEERAKNQALQDEVAAANARFESMIQGEPGPWVAHGEEDDMPAPTHLSLDSPVIQTILQAWTRDKDNLNYFNAWCRKILTKQNLGDVEKGVELNKCTNQVKDGILSLLLPMLRARNDITVSVFTRERVQVNYDIRLRVNLL